MTLQKTYEKDKVFVITNTKFIYCCEIYKVYNDRFELNDTKYYSCNKALVFKKKDLILKKKEYLLRRFFDLEFAPENYLINNNFKLVENERDL